MSARNVFKALEVTFTDENPREILDREMVSGALGGVTTWGSGIAHRNHLRIFWEEETLPIEYADAAEDLVEEDWTHHWRESLDPVRISDRFTVSPPWSAKTDGDRGQTILIDPGMAFGAGDHPTTRLCIKLLEKVFAGSQSTGSVLDVGAGTGVLSIAAAKLGATQVDALDIDPFCYSSCRRNFNQNGVEGAATPLLLSLDLLDKRYDLVMANIVAGQLEHLSEELISHTKKGGMVLLSGFEKRSLERVTGAFSTKNRVEYMEEEGWIALLLE